MIIAPSWECSRCGARMASVQETCPGCGRRFGSDTTVCRGCRADAIARTEETA